MRSEPDQKTVFRRQIFILAGLVVLSWGTTLFTFVQSRLSAPEPLEQPLKAENARLDVIRWQPAINDQKQYATNIFLSNNGKSTIRQLSYAGMAASAAANIDNDTLDALFIVAKNKTKASIPSKSEINPGQADQYMSVPNVLPLLQLNDDNIQAYKDGKLLIYTVFLMMYKDDSTPSGKYIYGEKCVYFIKDVVHYCEAGHNRNYIAD